MTWGAVAGAAISVVGGAVASNSAKKSAEKQQAAIDAANEKGGVPDWARPFVDDAMGKAQAVANKPYEAYTGQLTAPRNPYELSAASGIKDWANGTPQAEKLNIGYDKMVSNPGAGVAGAKTAYESMVNNPGRFTAGAAPTSTAYADNHLGTAQNMTASTANNDYIGKTSQGIAGAPQVGGLLGNNPYLGQSAGQISGAPSVSTGKNALLGMNNPYLQEAIDFAQGDVTRNYERSTAPQQAQRMAASGSFGNTGLMSQDSEERRNFAGELGRVSSGMRMQDYGLQAQLGESDLSRRLGADQFNASNALTTQQTNAGLRSQDLARNLSGFQQQQGMGLDAGKFDANNIMNTQQFNANQGQADLARNAGLQQQQGQYNASALTGQSQYNTGANNAMSLANAGIQNNTNQFNVNNLNAASNFNANAATQTNQFNSSQMANMYGQGAAGLMNTANYTANQTQQGLNGLLAMDGRGLQANQALGLLGSNERAIDQQGLAAQYEQWLRQQNDAQNKSANYNAALGTLVNKTNPIRPDDQVSPAVQGMGAGLALWGALKPSNATGNNVANMGKTVDNTEYQNMYGVR